MKKTFSMLLAVIMAAIAVCTFSVVGFADENDDPVDGFVTEATTKAAEVATTAAATTPATTAAATEAPATTAAATTEAPSETAPLFTLPEIPSNLEDILASAPIVTLAPGQTAVIEDDTTAATKAPSTTKKPAKVDSAIPGTGSSIVPAIALLALAAGTVAVVKTKKED